MSRRKNVPKEQKAIISKLLIALEQTKSKSVIANQKFADSKALGSEDRFAIIDAVYAGSRLKLSTQAVEASKLSLGLYYAVVRSYEEDNETIAKKIWRLSKMV